MSFGTEKKKVWKLPEKPKQSLTVTGQKHFYKCYLYWSDNLEHVIEQMNECTGERGQSARMQNYTWHIVLFLEDF